MTKQRKKIIIALVAAVIGMYGISLVARRHMSLLPRMLGHSRFTGDTALHWAADDGRTGAVEKLLAKGEDVNCTNKSGETPLHHAALKGHRKTVELLIAKGADVNAKESVRGATPLHRAAGAGQADVVELLLDQGANVDAVNDDGKTALDYANSMLNPPIPGMRFFLKLRGGHRACVELLRQHTAKRRARTGTDTGAGRETEK